MHRLRLFVSTFFVFLSASVCSAAVTNTWDGSESMDWFTAGNWSTGVPSNGHHVVITNVGNAVLLTNSTADLGSFTITNKILTFTNWTTTLNASNVTIQSGGELTLPPPFTESQMSNRVHIVCTNFTVASGGTIDANAKGYAHDQGPGKGTAANEAGGAGYGGKGGDGYAGLGGNTYGSTNAPIDPGSGGGSYSLPTYPGGKGGGAIWIEAAGNVTVNGTIQVNGGNAGSWSGGGSGGAIFITCNTFGGSTDATLSANGGNGAGNGGAGGGGRIAIIYNSLAGQHSVQFSASPGSGYAPFDCRKYAELGTLYFSNTNMLSTVLADMSGYLFASNWTSWAPASLTISNRQVGFEKGFKLNIGGNLLVVGTNAGVVLGRAEGVTNSELTCGGNMVLTNGGSLTVYSGQTNGLTVDYGALVSVTGNMWIGCNSWVYPYSDVTNGGSVLFRMNNLEISTNGGFNAYRRGYAWDQGPEKGMPGNEGGGAGYGGKGGDGSGGAGGDTYGSTNAPIDPGSGGGSYNPTYLYYRGGNGGGAIWIEAAGNVTVNGTIQVNGGNAGSWSGGGSGGGIFIMCEQFAGSTDGLLSADGGTGGGASGGGGGGGRIAVGIGLSDEARAKLLAGEQVDRLYTYQDDTAFAGTISVTNGTGWKNPPAPEGAYPGTAIFLTTNYCLTVTGDPANYDNPTPYGYGTHIDIPEGSSVTNSVSSPVDQADGMRHTCFGWSLACADGTPTNSGTSTQAVFQLTTNLVLTWNWTNEYELTVSSGNTNNGTVNTNVNGWYTNAVSVTNITATATNGYEFLEWTGDVPSGQETTNPLTVTMDQARTIVGNFCSLAGEIKIWTGNGNWISSTNWSPEGMPGFYDHAVIESGTLTLSDSRQTGALTVSNNATLVFTNWTAMLTASNVTILTNGTITLPPAFTESQMSNRVYIVCTNLTLESGGVINADKKGYAVEKGPGAGYDLGGRGSGAGYGGKGGDKDGASGGSTYGSTNAPIDPGSGGGDFYGYDVPGGGVVRIEAADVTVNGTISANGGSAADWSGGGSGGAIYITCNTFGGSINGLLSANGGSNTAASNGSGGGGGRIAVWYRVPQDRIAGILDESDMRRVSIAAEYSEFEGTVSVTNGTGWEDPPSADGAYPGTIVFLTVTPPSGTMFMAR